MSHAIKQLLQWMRTYGQCSTCKRRFFATKGCPECEEVAEVRRDFQP